MLKILVVEDEENLRITLGDYLLGLGYFVETAENGKVASAKFKEINFNVILMDIGLPDTDGLALALKFRSERKNFTLLFLSALNDPETKLAGLELGADDYITKPFALKELTLRLNRIIKSIDYKNALPDEITHGNLKIWFKRFEVMDGNQNIINLSHKECAILELLYTKQNEGIDREEIIEKIWGEDKFPSNRTVDNYIVKLRKWCESDPKNSIEIQSIRGIGYKLIINK